MFMGNKLGSGQRNRRCKVLTRTESVTESVVHLVHIRFIPLTQYKKNESNQSTKNTVKLKRTPRINEPHTTACVDLFICHLHSMKATNTLFR